ncbi:HesA/MoeB/ThiF family protein [Pseudoalteromonas rubra]|uniref:Molybdopterin-synthase adenylyltransferase n=1 Tax=Pseudoalteromonas rubra TaxID=43658 RepID=A0A0F4QW10_9GAMM|nr:HesA/MoeB/ThiF family protein [Pseudoalteromonas rubra]KJZ11425.1 hypothetical protein TW77_05980 [Pseudoalteromonas rubra]
MSVNIDDDELKRYARQLRLPDMSIVAQTRLKKARVLIVGAGGLGNPVAISLAAAGTGNIGIVDDDTVEISNLHRQTAFTDNDIGRSKSQALCEYIRKVNPYVNATPYDEKLTILNARRLFSQYEIIIDACDNFETRYLINDTCVLLKKPNVSAAIFNHEGQLSNYVLNGGPCLRCLFPEPPPAELAPNCAEAGVLNTLSNTFGALQANEAIKLITASQKPLNGELVHFNLSNFEFNKLSFARDPHCKICNQNQSIRQKVSLYLSLHQIDQDDQSPAHVWTYQTLRNKFANDEPFTVVDIREENELGDVEFQADYHIPYSELSLSNRSFKKIKTPVVFCCLFGKNSLFAAMKMNTLDSQKYYSLKGGILNLTEKDRWDKI